MEEPVEGEIGLSNELVDDVALLERSVPIEDLHDHDFRESLGRGVEDLYEVGDEGEPQLLVFLLFAHLHKILVEGFDDVLDNEFLPGVLRKEVIFREFL